MKIVLLLTILILFVVTVPSTTSQLTNSERSMVEDSTNTATTTMTTSDVEKQEEDIICNDSETPKEQPVAILASKSRIDQLLSWLSHNSNSMIGGSFVIPGEIYQRIQWDIPLQRMMSQHVEMEELTDMAFGGDIILAERILTGKISKVVYFHDATTTNSGNNDDYLPLLLRACDIGNVPIALNEASANIALQALKATRKAYLIFNPIAGQRDSNEDLSIIKETLGKSLMLTIIETEKDLDPAIQAKKVIDIIKKAEEEDSTYTSMIIASGGDGTVSAIAGATIGSGIAFGVIPRGTANAFSVALGIPTEVRAACHNIIKGNVRVVDGAMAGDTPMILLAGIGFEAGMVENASREIKDKLGPVAYVLGGVKQFFTQETFKCSIQIEGGVDSMTDDMSVDVTAITIANVAPPTSIMAQGFGRTDESDGKLDVTISSANDLLSGLVTLGDLIGAAVVQAPVDNNDNILCLRVRSISISCNPKQMVVIDGEMVEMPEDKPMTFKAIPGGLKVVAPPVQP